MITINDFLTIHNTKEREHTKSLLYYDSQKSPTYLSARLRAFFEDNPYYLQNWLALVVDAVRNKLRIEGFAVGKTDAATATDDPRQERLNEMWDNLQLAVEADVVHEFAHATGEAFIVSGVNEAGEPVAYAHDPRTVSVYYGGDNPNQITQAIKFWMEGTTHKATAWSLQEGKVFEESLTGRKSTEKDREIAKLDIGISYASDSDGDLVQTDYPRIPVFHFRRSSRIIKPEFYQATPIQDAVNKAFILLGMSTENATDKIKYIITAGDPSEMATARAGDTVPLTPAEVHEQPVTVGEFSTADLTQILAEIAALVASIAAITQTPRHYFGDVGGSALSGEALQAMESPTVAKIERYIRRYASEWEALGAFLLTLDGAETATAEITCHYADPRTSLITSQAQARMANTTAGIPIITQLRAEGWRDNEIEALLNDRITEQGTTIDERAQEVVYDRMAEKAEAKLEPMIEVALRIISDKAVDAIARDPAAIKRITDGASRAGAQP